MKRFLLPQVEALESRLPLALGYVRVTSPITEFAGAGFLTGSIVNQGNELWRTDGTPVGTALVKDIRSGSAASQPRLFTNVNGTLFFIANDGVNGEELWKTDGTTAGTVLVKDILLGEGESEPRDLAVFNGKLYFSANDGVHGRELWTSDGTSSGTVLVKDLLPGSESADPRSFESAGQELFFVAGNGERPFDLWKTDGTSTGTVFIADRVSNASLVTDYYLTNVNGQIFFRGFDLASGDELWVSDGTLAGTRLVEDICPFNNCPPRSLVNVSGTLFFRASDSDTADELWRSDGTVAGTSIVKDINPGAPSSDLKYLTNVNGTLYFRTRSDSQGFELWRSDGTTAGTIQVTNINEGQGAPTVRDLVNVNGTVAFIASAADGRSELWQVIGESSSSVEIRDAATGTVGTFARNLSVVNGRLFFTATVGTSAVLWISDGTQEGTRIVLRNAPPSFLKGADVEVRDDGGPQAVSGWATDIVAGPSDEASQALTFEVTLPVAQQGLFAVQPSITPDGTLSFTPQPNVAGEVDVTVVLKDDGGSVIGGESSSAPQVFRLTITKPHPWNNASTLAAPLVGSLDVDGNGSIAPVDAVLIINYLNSGLPSTVPADAQIGGPDGIGPGKTRFLDTGGGLDGRGNNNVAPSDAILVINWLNAYPPATGTAAEGKALAAGPLPTKATSSEVDTQPRIHDEALLAVLITDLGSPKLRKRRTH